MCIRDSAKDGVIITGDCQHCVSRVGAYDMVGNVAELVTDEEGNPAYFAGGNMYSMSMPNCQSVSSIPAEPWDRSLGYGFRCCKDTE